MRVVVSMAGGPPARDPVDELAAVAEKNTAPLRARDGQRVRRRLHLRVGQPNMTNAARKPVRRCAAHLSPPIPRGAGPPLWRPGLPTLRAAAYAACGSPAATWTAHCRH